MTTYTTLFQHLFYSFVPQSFPEDFRNFLTMSLDREVETQNDEMQSASPGGKRRLVAPSPHLHRLTVLPRYSTTLLRVAYEEIEKIAREEAAMGWEEQRLAAARKRLSETVVPWMSGVFDSKVQDYAPS